jgi:hypothetical protein
MKKPALGGSLIGWFCCCEGYLQESSAELLRVFRALTQVAGRTRHHEVLGSVAAALDERDDMVDVVGVKLCMTVVAAALLACVLSNRKGVSQ